MPKVLALKTIDFCFLAVVGLHQLGVRETFLSDRADRTAAAPLLTGGTPDQAGEMPWHEPEEGGDDQRYQGELPLDVQQRAGEVDDAQDVGDSVPDAREDKALDRCYVASEPGDHVTEWPALEEIKRKALQVAKQMGAQRKDKLPPHPARKITIADREGPGQQGEPYVAERDPPERP